MQKYLPAFPVEETGFSSRYSNLRAAREAASLVLNEFSIELATIAADGDLSADGKKKKLQAKTREQLAREQKFAAIVADAEKEIETLQKKIYGGLGRSDASDAATAVLLMVPRGGLENQSGGEDEKKK